MNIVLYRSLTVDTNYTTSILILFLPLHPPLRLKKAKVTWLFNSKFQKCSSDVKKHES